MNSLFYIIFVHLILSFALSFCLFPFKLLVFLISLALFYFSWIYLEIYSHFFVFYFDFTVSYLTRLNLIQYEQSLFTYSTLFSWCLIHSSRLRLDALVKVDLLTRWCNRWHILWHVAQTNKTVFRWLTVSVTSRSSWDSEKPQRKSFQRYFSLISYCY